MLAKLWRRNLSPNDKNVVFESLRGLDFSEYVVPESLSLNSETHYPYEHNQGRLLRDVLDSMPITSSDSILDVGCGKGCALKICRSYPFGTIDGYAASDRFVEIARRDMKRLGLQSNIMREEAETFAAYDKYNYVYLFNPFPRNVVEVVLRNINASLERAPREFKLLYENPIHCDVVADLTRRFKSYETTIKGYRRRLLVFDHGK
ncbi:MAG: class I SAM-dependent methyltransferase [Thermoguttaceae bacterium]|nr:class I SAM-dependent methyltransferase [Thermoguttaceae bacterium]